MKTTKKISPGSMLCNATISKDIQYRYLLSRTWLDKHSHMQRLGFILWVMLNPSKANQFIDDPTVVRCIGFTQRLHFNSFKVVNLFAYRTKSPKVLKQAEDPIGPGNDQYIQDAARQASLIIYAWGANAPKINPARAAAVHDLISAVRPKGDRRNKLYVQHPQVLGFTKDGHPRHPLFLPYDIELEPFR